jgi:hypothetical protein
MGKEILLTKQKRVAHMKIWKNHIEAVQNINYESRI